MRIQPLRDGRHSFRIGLRQRSYFRYRRQQLLVAKLLTGMEYELRHHLYDSLEIGAGVTLGPVRQVVETNALGSRPRSFRWMPRISIRSASALETSRYPLNG